MKTFFTSKMQNIKHFLSKSKSASISSDQDSSMSKTLPEKLKILGALSKKNTLSQEKLNSPQTKNFPAKALNSNKSLPKFYFEESKKQFGHEYVSALKEQHPEYNFHLESENKSEFDFQMKIELDENDTFDEKGTFDFEMQIDLEEINFQSEADIINAEKFKK